ncbi:MAG TPA: NADH-quinone oxidoreductase subunit L, partial [Chloroflexota bacterium]|nr:NADH-quinone oxidoreductase subunit L [Chloroflexota bacterium]
VWCVCFGRLWPRSAGRVASVMVGLSFVVAVIVFTGLTALAPDDRIRVGEIYTWIGSGAYSIPLGIYLDPLSTAMLLVVTGVSFLIHVYATGYMAGDPGIGRFFAYMNLFVFSMILLVLAGNFVLLMVGWGGVGLCSYLLIAFYSNRPEAAAAGVKAFVVNAVGDVGLILAAALILLTFKAADFVTVFNGAKQVADQGGASTITTITLLLLVAAIAKSAQLPLYFWLPDAMAGPTPVSALIHAATMVTAGVYLIARAAPLYSLAPSTMALVAWIGALTALFAATIGLVKSNIKRVLAYSTVSQLGYMFLAVGVGGYAAGIFHLATHAFFKALLFLGAGAVIHALGGEEDMNRMGGLARRLPLTYVTFLIGGLAISGVPGLSGFFSKDEIISLAF